MSDKITTIIKLVRRIEKNSSVKEEENITEKVDAEFGQLGTLAGKHLIDSSTGKLNAKNVERLGDAGIKVDIIDDDGADVGRIHTKKGIYEF